MEKVNIWNTLSAFKTIYTKCVDPVCRKYNLTRTELDVMLFLANHPRYNTPTEISNYRHLAKSQISISVRSLNRSGYLERIKQGNDRRKAHWKLTNKAEPIVNEGKKEQDCFVKILFRGFDNEDRKELNSYLYRLEQNMNAYLAEHKNDV